MIRSRSPSSTGTLSETSDEAATTLFLFSEVMRRGDYAISWLAVISLFKDTLGASGGAWTHRITMPHMSTTTTGTAWYVTTNAIPSGGR